jgi:hypothetical protein
MQQKTTREEKAQQLYAAGVHPIKTNDGWMVPGSNGKMYDVTCNYDQWNCTCPDALYRSHQGEMCKHVLLIQKCQHKVHGCIEIHDDIHDIHLKREVVVVF